MFETMQSFLSFFFPTLALIILGILFEEKLIALEDRIAQKLFGGKENKRARTQSAARRAQQRPALRRMDTHPVQRRSGKNRAA